MVQMALLLATVLYLIGCQSQLGPADHLSACRQALTRFESALTSGDRAAFDSLVFCADQTETEFVRALFDLYAADRELDRRGRETFGENWAAIKLKAQMIAPPQFSQRPILLLSNFTALAKGSDGNGLYLIRLGSQNHWSVQAASIFDPRQTREANLELARMLADEHASIARNLGTKIRSEYDLRQAQAEISGLILFGDRRAVKLTTKRSTETAPAEPMNIPPDTINDGKASFIGVSGKKK